MPRLTLQVEGIIMLTDLLQLTVFGDSFLSNNTVIFVIFLTGISTCDGDVRVYPWMTHQLIAGPYVSILGVRGPYSRVPR